MTPDLDCTSEGGLLGDAANSSTSYNPMSPDEDDAGVGAHGVDVVDDDSDCCAKSGCSLEDTLSLTCDESLSSSNMEESSDNELAVVYSSPDILRRRLLPLAPSPIETVYAASPLVRGRQESRWQWRLRPSFRVLWLTMSMILYLFATLVDFRWMVESVGEVGLSKEAQQWNRFFRRKGPKIMEKIHSKSTSPEFTIRIKGSRLDLISQSLDFHHQCLSVKSVQVEWTDSSRPLPKSILNHKSGKVEMMQKPKTTALLLLDEDVILSCDEIERGASLTVPSLDIYLLITDTGLHGSHPFFFSFIISHLQPFENGARIQVDWLASILIITWTQNNNKKAALYGANPTIDFGQCREGKEHTLYWRTEPSLYIIYTCVACPLIHTIANNWDCPLWSPP